MSHQMWWRSLYIDGHRTTVTTILHWCSTLRGSNNYEVDRARAGRPFNQFRKLLCASSNPLHVFCVAMCGILGVHDLRLHLFRFRFLLSLGRTSRFRMGRIFRLAWRTLQLILNSPLLLSRPLFLRVSALWSAELKVCHHPLIFGNLFHKQLVPLP